MQHLLTAHARTSPTNRTQLLLSNRFMFLPTLLPTKMTHAPCGARNLMSWRVGRVPFFLLLSVLRRNLRFCDHRGHSRYYKRAT